MPFKTTVRNQRNSHYVASSAISLAKQVEMLINEKLAAQLHEGEKLPDMRLFQELISRYLEKSGSDLLAADDRYSTDQVTARNLKVERNELANKLRLRLRDARQLFDRLGKERSEATLPKRGFTKLSPAELIRLAKQVIIVLRDTEGASSRIVSEEPGTYTAVIEGLEADSGQLQEVIDLYEGLQARKKQTGLAEKSAQIAASSKAIRGGASLLAGLYTFADLPFHAQRIRRPANRRPLKSEEEEGTSQSPPAETKEAILPV